MGTVVNKLAGSVNLGSIRVEAEFGTLDLPASLRTEIQYQGDTLAEGGKVLHHVRTSMGERRVTDAGRNRLARRQPLERADRRAREPWR